MNEGANSADLVIEAIPERLGLKREIFAQLDKVCPGHTILGTNSSSIRISEIENATNCPDKVLNTHFYPPIWQRPMVELMQGTKTSDETIEKVCQFARSIRLTPIVASGEERDYPPRLLMDTGWNLRKSRIWSDF